jgi:hypothetical protein
MSFRRNETLAMNLSTQLQEIIADWQDAVADDPALTAKAKLLAWRVARNCQSSLTWQISTEELAKLEGIARSTAFEGVHELCEKGYLQRNGAFLGIIPAIAHKRAP